MKLKILFIRAKDGKRIEKEGDFSTLAIYDRNNLLYSRGKIE